MLGMLDAARVIKALLIALALIGVSAIAADDFLDPAIAFKFSARMVDDHTIEAQWTAADGYYMYREKFAFTADHDVQLGPAEWPKGKVKFDETFGKEVETHRGVIVARVPVLRGSADFTLTAMGQGCADQGLCYPPQESTVKLTLASSGVSSSQPSSAAPATRAEPDNGAFANALRSGSLVKVVSVFFVLGLLLAFTPCVLPMVPILSSIIVGQTDGSTPMRRSRAFSMALAYSLGMAIVYTALGVAAGLAGEGLAATLQQPWVLVAFAAALVALSLSMFGFYELQLPAAWQSKLANASNAQRGGRTVGVFVMGALSALIVSPCVAAPLAGALLYISQTRDVVVGGVALFAMAAGMSVPLLLVGASAGALLPRAGRWMEGIKRFFGVLLLAVALWMISPVVPAWLSMLAWAVLLIVSAMFLRAFDALPDNAPGGARLLKGLGVVVAMLGAVLIVGIATGSRDVLQPLDRLALDARISRGDEAQRASRPERATRWQAVTSVAQLDAIVAGANGKPIMLDFYADWCVSCKEMERFTFNDPRVAAQLDRMVLLQADVTKNNADDRALLKRFELFGPPGTIFFDHQGREAKSSRVIGYQDATTFLASMQRAIGP